MNLNVIQGDITQVHADVIVNAANPALRGGGGVDGAIHRAAGPSLLAYETWMYPHGTRTAVPVVTPAFDLPARWLIHVPGPDYRDRSRYWSNADLLWCAYARSVALAGLLGAGTMTFPSISTGIFEFPLERAAGLAIDAIQEAQRNRAPSVHTVAIVAFDTKTANAYREAL